MEFAGLFFVLLVVAFIATAPLWFIVLPGVLREQELLARLRAEEEKRRQAAVADMWRHMGALGLWPEDYTKEQLRQMQERA